MAKPPSGVNMKPAPRSAAAMKRKNFDDVDDAPIAKKPKSEAGNSVAKDVAPKTAAAPKATTAPKTAVAAKKPAAPKTDAAAKKTAAPKTASAVKTQTAPEKTVAPKTTAASKKIAAAKAVPKKPTAAKGAATEKPAAKKVAAATKVLAKATTEAQKSNSVKAAAKVKTTAKLAKNVPAINEIPSKTLDVYVFGEGSSGELGLGSVLVSGEPPVNVDIPRLNHNLSADIVGIVHIAVGGMHCAALTKDNQILTWGVNDEGALGRDTKWDRVLTNTDDVGSDYGPTDTGINPKESTPTAVSDEHFPAGIKFVQLAASDSATFALTADGSVYGWGTFRSNDGVLGFSEKIYIQTTPIQIPQLKKITYIATGANHALALDQKGNVWAWGSGQQNQLGRRIVERTRLGGLVPREFGLPKNKVASIASGSYHSFAIDNKGQVWSWGLNNFGETGICEGAGEDNAVVPTPTIVTELQSHAIKEIRGGGHHSIACTDAGKLLVWGRMDGHQVGMKAENLPEEDIVFDERGEARILIKPTVVPGLQIVSVAAGTDNSFAITNKGKAYSWGFNANYQAGQGTDEDVEVPTLIQARSVRDKKLCFAGAGGQFSVLAGLS